MKHLNNSKSVHLGVGGIDLTSGLVISTSMMIPTALITPFAI